MSAREDTQADTHRTCKGCGNHVTEQFLRVFVPDGARPEACPHPDCAGKAQARNAAAAFGRADRAGDVEKTSEIAREQRIESARSFPFQGR